MSNMPTSPRILDHDTIIDLVRAGDATTLGTALRNVLALTDTAIHAEEISTSVLAVTIRPAAIHKALDAAVRGEPYRAGDSDLRKADNPLWNEAIDWLLNSRHTADPDIQAAFWGLVDGKFTRDQADAGHFKYDNDGKAYVPSED